MYYIKPEPWLSRPCIGFDRCPASFFSKSNGLWHNILVTKNNFFKNINTFFCESPPNITCFEVFLNTSFLTSDLPLRLVYVSAKTIGRIVYYFIYVSASGRNVYYLYIINLYDSANQVFFLLFRPKVAIYIFRTNLFIVRFGQKKSLVV